MKSKKAQDKKLHVKKSDEENKKKKFRDKKHDIVDESSIESFPASDSPSTY